MRGASIGLPIPRAPKLPLNHNEDFSDWQTVAAEVFGIHRVNYTTNMSGFEFRPGQL
jgi:hypothetical protein